MAPSQIISYTELVTREQQNLQKGMNYRTGVRPSVFLMSMRPGAPYKDAWFQPENLLVYEGPDLSAREGKKGAKKETDQPLFERSGSLTDNGKFFKAAHDYRLGRRQPLRIQVYEKVADGIWYDKGCFELIDATFEKDGTRNVFRYFLRPSETEARVDEPLEYRHERMIPSAVKLPSGSGTRDSVSNAAPARDYITITSFHSRKVGEVTMSGTFNFCAHATTSANATTLSRLMPSFSKRFSGEL